MIIYVSIGNSDDKLSQARWHELVLQVKWLIEDHAATVHGRWFSEPSDQWQNACTCFEITESAAEGLRRDLQKLGRRYDQDAITWAIARTEFL